MTASASNGLETWVSVSVRTDVGMRRAGNEDNLQVVDLTNRRLGLTHREAVLSPDVARHRLGPLGTLLIVSDGMGGAAAGEVASEMAVEIVAREMLRQMDAGVPIHDAMRCAADSANAAIWERSQNESAVRGLGATLTAVHLSAQGVVVSQVGDSRAYLIRNGVIRQLTEDQSWAAAAKKAGMQVANVPSNVILQALGTQRVVNTDITTETLQTGDIFLLCSDGLSNKVEEHELARHVTTAESLSAAAETLVRLANDRGGEDNITVVIAKVALESQESPGDLRLTQQLASAGPSDDGATIRITPGRGTAELNSSETYSNLSVPTRDSLPTAGSPTRPLASSGPSPADSASPSRGSMGGKLFVVLALVAVGVIVAAGAAAMVWVLQSRAAKRTEASKPSSPPAMQPAETTSDTDAQASRQDGSKAAQEGGIGRRDDLDEVEKKLKLAKKQADEMARRMPTSPAYKDIHRACRENCARLKELMDTLNRHRRRETRAGDLSVADIEQEVNRIRKWMDDLPSEIRSLKDSNGKRASEGGLLNKAAEKTTELLENASQELLPQALRPSIRR